MSQPLSDAQVRKNREALSNGSIHYVPMLNSSTYRCSYCHGMTGTVESVQHKKGCPNYAEGGDVPINLQ